MVHALYREDPEGEPMDDIKIAATVAAYTRHPGKVDILVAEEGEGIIGYALLVWMWRNEYGGDTMRIDELYIKEAYRNQGVGAAFIQYIEETYASAALELEVTPSNHRALTFYRRMGFVPSEKTHLCKRYR